MKPINEQFATILRDRQAGLRAYIRRLGIASDSVDDMAQDVFLVAYRRWSDFDQDRDVGRWLNGIARNVVANELRKGRRKARVIYSPLTDKLLEAMDQGQCQPNDSDVGHLIQTMNECIKRLPRLSRELLYHRYADQKNARQLSEQHHTSPVAIRLKLMRIRAAVKGCIEGKLA